jgi:hypothetical protein
MITREQVYSIMEEIANNPCKETFKLLKKLINGKNGYIPAGYAGEYIGKLREQSPEKFQAVIKYTQGI